MPSDHTRYEIFVSYARRDNEPAVPGTPGWVTALRDHILADHRRFDTTQLRIFLADFLPNIEVRRFSTSNRGA